MTEFTIGPRDKASMLSKMIWKGRRLLRLLFVRWPQKRRQRLELREMTKERLQDIGVEPHQALHEAKRHYWD